MDFFQGSTPPNFISFCLVGQNEDEPQTSSNTVPDLSVALIQEVSPPSNADPIRPPVPSPPPFPPLVPTTSRNQTGEMTPLYSPDSNTDVTSYADEMVQRLEDAHARRIAEADVTIDTALNTALNSQVPESNLNPLLPRSSTPTLDAETAGLSANLSQLETALGVVIGTQSDLPVLVPVPLQTELRERSDGDNASSTCDFPGLPKDNPKVHFLTDDPTESEKTGDDTSHVEEPALYSSVPFGSESGTEAGDESGPGHDTVGPGMPSSSRGPDDHLPELTGRSRAILKTYFADTKPFNLPLGHPTVAFTEAQMYHLLRVLSDETLRMSYSTMGKMVVDAVRGKPTVAPSKTSHFLIRNRAQTPGRWDQNDQSSSEAEYDSSADSRALTPTSAGDTGDSSFEGESDSATEMALISATLGGESQLVQSSQEKDRFAATCTTGGDETTGPSSQETTLLELQQQARGTKAKGSSGRKLSTKPRKLASRGVPMREEFFAKIGWTRSFISGPADPVHNPHMVWCHMCKKNFSIRSKGAFEILRHHRTERHLRRDQRWRYEHLKSVDPSSGKIRHRVRGRNGKVLTAIELAKELPKFIHTELVDVGERFPFYDDFMQGRPTALVTSESRAKLQLSIIGDFLQTQGDFSLLKSLWSRISAHTDYQANLCDFDWSEERITVGSFL